MASEELIKGEVIKETTRAHNVDDLPLFFEILSTLEVGMVFSFADAAGGEVPGVVDSFDEESVRVNFNHPLAGRSLTFEVKIDRVEPAEVH